MIGRLTMVVVAATLITAPAAGQDAAQFRVGPRLGYVQYAEETGIKPGAALGMDAMYRLSRNIAFGVALGVSRPETDGQYFPAELSFGDTTYVFQVTQPLTITTYQFALEFSTGGSFAPFLSAAVGGYRVALDPQVASGNRDFTHVALTLGGGVSIQAGGAASIRLNVHDQIFSRFDRAGLNTTRTLNQPVIFPEAVPPLPPFSGTAHNIMASLGFYFTPGGN